MAFQCLYLQLLQARVWICLFHKKISAFLVFTEIIFAVRNPLDCFCSSTELTAQKHTLQVTSTARLNWTASDHPFHHDQRAPPTRLRTPPPMPQPPSRSAPLWANNKLPAPLPRGGWLRLRSLVAVMLPATFVARRDEVSPTVDSIGCPAGRGGCARIPVPASPRSGSFLLRSRLSRPSPPLPGLPLVDVGRTALLWGGKELRARAERRLALRCVGCWLCSGGPPESRLWEKSAWLLVAPGGAAVLRGPPGGLWGVGLLPAGLWSEGWRGWSQLGNIRVEREGAAPMAGIFLPRLWYTLPLGIWFFKCQLLSRRAWVLCWKNWGVLYP